jgi:hypothetical protein
MLFHKIAADERTRSSTRQAAAIWLGVTQVLLAGALLHRLYVLGQPDEQLRDFQAVLAISIFGYLLIIAYLGGVLPVPTWKGAALVYAALVSVITIVSVSMHGWPAPGEWSTTWLPALAGPAILIGGYMAVLRLGHWLTERRIG